MRNNIFVIILTAALALAPCVTSMASENDLQAAALAADESKPAIVVGQLEQGSADSCFIEDHIDLLSVDVVLLLLLLRIKQFHFVNGHRFVSQHGAYQHEARQGYHL